MSENKINEQFQVINVEQGIAALSGDRQMFFSMLEQFEGLSFTAGMENMFIAIKEKNWKEVQGQGHTLKGTSGYIHAEKFYHQCEKLQSSLKEQIKENKFQEKDNIMEYFQLLEYAKEMKIELDKLNNKQPDPSSIDNYMEEIKQLYPYVIEPILERQLTKQKSVKDRSQTSKNSQIVISNSPKLEKEVAPKDSMCKNCKIF